MIKYLKCKLDYYSTYSTAIENIPQVPLLPGLLITSDLVIDDELYIELNGHKYQKNLLFLNCDILYNRIRKIWRQVENLVLNNNATKQDIRSTNEVITLLLYSYYNLKCTGNEAIHSKIINCINLFKNSVSKLAEVDDNVLNNLTSNVICNEDEPISQYFHFYFGIFYLILHIEKLCKSEKFTLTYKHVMEDLIKLSEKMYEKHKDEILYIQPHLCFCIKNLWIYLQYISDKNQFWETYNQCIEGRDSEFSLWFTYHITLLYHYDMNGIVKNCDLNEESVNNILVNKVLQRFLSNYCSEMKLLNVMKLSNLLLTEQCIKYIKLEPYQILWDYFCKNLNNDIANTVIPKSVNEIMEKLNDIQENIDNLKNSYELFLYLLYKYLRVHPQYWKKLQGRIYSRLPVQKVKEFNDVGIYNISLLYFMLSSLDVKDVLDQLTVLLENLSEDRENTEFIWIIYTSLMVISTRQKHNIPKLSNNLQKLIKFTVENRANFHLIRHYINGLNIIFEQNELPENHLLGHWIISYASTCTNTDLSNLLRLLTDILEKSEVTGKWNHYKNAYLDHVIPALKQISFTSSATQIGRLSGKILLKNPEMNSLIAHFCNESINIEVNIEVLNEFLKTILTDNRHLINFNSNQENLLISAWGRINLLHTGDNKDLSKRVLNLQMIKNCIIIENMEESDLFLCFLKGLNKQLSQSQTNAFRLREICQICFGNVDRWIPTYLSAKRSDAQILYLFTRISLIFFYCSSILYQKSKATCLLNRLISVILLPTDILIGKTPPSNILSAIEKTWHLFIKGIFKLDYKSDPYIDRTLKDLIVRYLPHFSTSNSPIINLIDDENMAIYTLEKITNNFLLHSARNSEENALKALKIIGNILEITTDRSKFKLYVQKTCQGILEVIMFNNRKSAALEIVKLLTISDFYPYIHEDIEISIKNITEKHLAFNTNYFFQLIDMLQKLTPDVVRLILPHIKEQVKHVERMRGVGYDNTLRLALNRIENV